MNELILIAESENRLDKFIADNIEELTRTAAVALIEAGNCAVNGKIAAKNYRLKQGDTVKVNIVAEPLQPIDVLPENIPLDVRYEDDSVIVVNKPRGMVVHPANGHYSGTLVNALMFRYSESGLSGINGKIRPGIVHRLDKDTSGLTAIAKNDAAHLSLCQQLKERTMGRTYEAVVQGRVKSQSGTVNAPIGRSVSDRKKMCVTSRNSREAVTHYEVVGYYDNFTHLRLKLETGRTHQIRVHMAYIGHAVAGDSVYGNGKPSFLNGQCLHAKKLEFIHPETAELIKVETELPDYFTDFLEKLKK